MSLWPSGLKCRAVTLPGKWPTVCYGVSAFAPSTPLPKRPTSLPRATASHWPSQGRVHRRDWPHRRVCRDPGDNELQTIRLLAFRGPRTGVDPGLEKRDSGAPGRGSSLGGMSGLAAPVKSRIMRLPLASPGNTAGPWAVPRWRTAA